MTGSTALELSLARSECADGCFENGFSSQQDVDQKAQRGGSCF